MPELIDKVALVSGAGSGIGQAIAVALAKAGLRVAITGRKVTVLRALAAQLNELGAHIEAFPADLLASEGRDSLTAWLLDTFGGVDVFVHAAGVARAGGANLSDEAFEEMMAINVNAAHGLTRRLLPSLIARRGQIVFINSRGGIRVMPHCTAYSATKFALRAYADGLREDLRPQGVRVISVCPGKTATPMLRALLGEMGTAYEPEKYALPEDIARATLDVLELPRHIEMPELIVRPARD